MVKFFHSLGIDVHASNGNSANAFMLACGGGNVEAIQYLIDQGVNKYHVDFKLENAVVYAAEQGHLHVLRFLEENGFENIGEDNRSSLYGYLCACHNGFLDVVSFFEERGMSVDSFDLAGDTACHYASHTGQLHILKHLVRKGAAFDKKGNEDITPLDVAIENEESQVARYLISLGANIDDLYLNSTEKKTFLRSIIGPDKQQDRVSA